MRRIFEQRLQLQLFFALAASCLVAALLVELVSDAVHHAEGYVLSDASRVLSQAIRELRREYNLRISGDSEWSTLPAGARDLSLRAISETVLAAYPGVEGGYWSGSQFLGYAFPTHGSPKYDVPAAERNDILNTIGQAREHGYAQRILRENRDFVVIAAMNFNRGAVWAMKRLPGQAAPAEREHSLLLACLVGAAFLSAAGMLATAYALRQGVAEIKKGLAVLNTDLNYRLPERHDELGEISAAINNMAAARRRLEAELQREDRLRTTGRLVGRVAHEMRNPLNGIRLALQAVARRAATGRVDRDDFQTILEEIDRMNRLLSDLLVFQQPRPALLQVLPVTPLLERCIQVVKPSADKRQISLTLKSKGRPEAALDESYFIQVCVNLLMNAIEASPPQGEVRVEAQTSHDGVQISVTDQGPGLGPEQREHLFEPFYTTKPNGHGLGLAVSRELMRSMHGDLVYEAPDGGGARFMMKLEDAIHAG